jgi:hypothetical protein
MATVGVLCARGRVEEKTLMAALADAGIVSALFPPADEPLPVGPLPIVPAVRAFPVPQIVVDRHPNRQIARAVLSTCRALDVPVLCGGIAATGDRLDVAAALAAHGLARPATALYTSDDAALAAVTALGIPATLLPLDYQTPPIALLDIDAAEAVVEHRSVLGGADGALGLIQASAPTSDDLVTVVVVDGTATALMVGSEARVAGEALHLAEEAARAVRADLIAVDVALGAHPLVWDMRPVPEFRHALPIAEATVAEAIAAAVQRRLLAPVAASLLTDPGAAWVTFGRDEVPGDVVVRA